MPPSGAAGAGAGADHPSSGATADVEAQTARPQPGRSTSRASLPLALTQPSSPHDEEHTDHQRSSGAAEHPVDGGNTNAAGPDGDEDYAWGPQHPCFPHPNPHVPLSSPLFQATRVIRIKRDWMVAGDLAPTFANLYPEVLDPLVSEEAFRRLIRHVNAELVAAFSPFTARAWLDAAMGVATGWLWDDLGLTGVKRSLARLEAWIEEWNRREGEREGVTVIPLRRTGYITLDFQIPDPHIGVDAGSNKEPNTPTTAGLTDALDTMRHGDLGPSRHVQDLGALRAAGGQQFLPAPAAVEAR